MTNLIEELCADADFRWDETDMLPDDNFFDEYADEADEDEDLRYAAMLRQLDELIAASETAESTT